MSIEKTRGTRFKIVEETIDEQTKFDKIVQHVREFWWHYVLYIMGTSIIVLFICSFIFDKSVSIEIMNSWVGIVLGVVATIIGIISMFLSFYNLDQSIKTQEKTLETIDNIKKEIINYVDKTSKETQDVIRRSQETQVSYGKSNVRASFRGMGENRNVK